MHKILYLFCFFISLVTFQASAAGLAWVDYPDNGDISGTNTEELFGDYNNSIPFGAIDDKWIFSSLEEVKTTINVAEFRDSDLKLKVTLDDVLLTFGTSQDIGSWFAEKILAPGEHTIGIKGKSFSLSEIDIRVTDLADNAPIVPIPPALWLFGSGLLGIVGLFKRKYTANVG